jgi:hypothetical protein
MASIIQVSRSIEEIVEESGIGYLDACLLYCERYGFEPEYVGEIIANNQTIMGKIQREAEDLHFIKKTPKLFSV